MEFFLIASAHFLALLSPGPDFFLIMQASLRLPLRYCLAVCGGISCANGMYLLSAVLGLEIIKDTAWLMSVLTYAGAVYLMFLGTMLLRTGRRLSVKDEAGAFLHTHSLARQFVIGFMSGILNPKNALFYLSLFTVMVSDQTSLETRFFYALWMMSVVLSGMLL